MKRIKKASLIGFGLLMVVAFSGGCASYAGAANYVGDELETVASVGYPQEITVPDTSDISGEGTDFDNGDKPDANDEYEPYEYAASFADRFGFDRDHPANVFINGYLTVVNKRNMLDPQYYYPTDLVYVPGGQRVSARILPDLQALFEAAENDGVPMRVLSGFRSYERQTVVHRNLLNQMGLAALRWSARPGHSEHQTGLAVDLLPAFGSHSCQEFRCFSATPHAQWLNENAVNFGFIVRYFYGSEEITGFAYEPWHLRWIGREVSSTMEEYDIWTLEELFDLPPAPNYLD